jgi:hypothetical protein
MSGEKVTASRWKEIGRTTFGRQFRGGYTCLEAIAFRNEKNGQIHLRVEVPNAQIFTMPRDLVALVEALCWVIACLACQKFVMLPRGWSSGPLGILDVWRGCCRILNSLAPWTVNSQPVVDE